MGNDNEQPTSLTGIYITNEDSRPCSTLGKPPKVLRNRGWSSVMAPALWTNVQMMVFTMVRDRILKYRMTSVQDNVAFSFA
jgi:hypothetical protein